MQQLNQIIKSRNNVAIYCRLSRDDGTERESLSISNQKEALRNYVLERNWSIYDIYIDDGYSGTNYDRPAFQQMISDIEAGLIDIVCTKDLSRLGRDYIKTGYYTEDFFPNHNVRYIAINDNVDTINEFDNDFIPIKNVINEWYAKDISKKINFTLQNKIKNGELQRTAYPKYGFIINEDNTRTIDPEAGEVVEFIYEVFLKYHSLDKVVNELKALNIYIPGYYTYLKYGKDERRYLNYPEENKTLWNKDKVALIIKSEEYKGTYIKGKTRKKFKQTKNVSVKKIDYHRFPNVYPQIVTPTTWFKANEILKVVSRKKTKEEDFYYTGICCCGICHSMLNGRKRTSKKTGQYYYKFYCDKGHGHKDMRTPTMTNKELDILVLNEIKRFRDYVLNNKEILKSKVKEFILNKQELNSPKDPLILSKIESLKERNQKLETLIRELFEEKCLLPRTTYESMRLDYSKEYNSNEEKILRLEYELSHTKSEPIDYKECTYILINYLENLNEEDYLSKQTINMIFSKIYLSREGIDFNNNPNIIEFEYNYIQNIMEDYISNEE